MLNGCNVLQKCHQSRMTLQELFFGLYKPSSIKVCFRILVMAISLFRTIESIRLLSLIIQNGYIRVRPQVSQSFAFNFNMNLEETLPGFVLLSVWTSFLFYFILYLSDKRIGWLEGRNNVLRDDNCCIF